VQQQQQQLLLHKSKQLVVAFISNASTSHI
jgi:hypothetical protein